MPEASRAGPGSGRRGGASPLPLGARAAGLLLAAACAACAAAPPGRAGEARAARELPDVPRPAPPEGCATVPAGADLQAAVSAAAPGSALCLAPGEHRGPLLVDRAVTIWGPREATIRNPGEGTTIRVAGAGAALLGFTADGSGRRYDLQDGAVYLEADGVRAEGLTIRDALFGVVAQRCSRIRIAGNRIEGTREEAFGLRGDSIHLWEVYDSAVEGNVADHARDMVVWYSSRNRIADNVVARGRYGTHFMYSHGNEVAGNRYLGNVVGVFVMYSRGVVVRNNLIRDSGGAAGIGLGLKEASGVVVEGNRFVRNTTALYIDASPFVPGETNFVRGNLLALSETAVLFHASPRENAFERNVLRDNVRQARVDGGGDATGVRWLGNDFDDYAGYDMDGDGAGDVPYELRRLSNELASTYPNLAFLHGAPAMGLVDAIGRIMPLFRPKTLLVDPAPSLRLPEPEGPRADRA